ncbi:MAG TPA: hypothetical protein VIV06_10390 [Candidatus Limnocylindrales bacterium]
MPDVLAPPGPSTVAELEVRAGSRPLRAGVGEPTTLTDDWWVTLLWVADESGLATFRALAPEAGPPAEPPLFRLGPSLAGGLAGLILAEGGRQMMRLRHGVPPADLLRPWDSPAVVVAAFRWEPARAAALGDRALLEAVLAAFRDAAAGLRHR